MNENRLYLEGTVGFDRKIFSGSPLLSDLDHYSCRLSDEEHAFLNGEVDELCELLDNHQISCDRDLPEAFWTRCKTNGIFGMIISKEFGGKGFSHNLHSQVLQKISTRSGCAAATVAVPNSLGSYAYLLDSSWSAMIVFIFLMLVQSH